ncbi:glycosyltransferase [Aestuariivita boseongensis]|uniref:glycosyltransferase n=1 Tax=Aestuariivita boseongensis TaxID=1470562 RepID=UPI000682F19C|nr:glycosyltransferase [Aestuariivita boseongensis]
MKLAYILNTYPQPSQSFIRRELAAIEAEGHAVLRLAMRRSDMALVDPLDREEGARTAYVLDAGALGLLGGLLREALRAPRRFWGALRLAMAMGRVSHVGRIRHLIYLAEACLVARALREAGITHMHAHFGTNSAAVAALAHVLGGVGYSFTVHGPEEFDSPRALSLGTKIEGSAFTVGVSEYGRSQLCRWVEAHQWPKVQVVHCGIEPARFADVTEVAEGPVRLVSIGRFAEQKGQLVLIAAMARLRAAGVDVSLRLLGDGPLRPVLEEAIAQAGLGDHVTLTGWLDEEGVRNELRAAKALVMPSFAEGLPMVIMEAMASARPVIATYVAGIPELVIPGDTGWLVPAGDDQALAQAVEELAQTPVETLRAMGEAGRMRALERHDIGVEARKLLQLMARAQTGD